MRPSEAAGLTWSQVHTGQRILDLTVTKTDPRRVPLTAVAVETLERVRMETGMNSHVFIPDNYNDPARPSRYFRKAFERACAALPASKALSCTACATVPAAI